MRKRYLLQKGEKQLLICYLTGSINLIRLMVRLDSAVQVLTVQIFVKRESLKSHMPGALGPLILVWLAPARGQLQPIVA